MTIRRMIMSTIAAAVLLGVAPAERIMNDHDSSGGDHGPAKESWSTMILSDGSWTRERIMNGQDSSRAVSMTVTMSTSTIAGLHEPIIVAHRGGAARYPEHSREAFAAAARAGFVLEPDVRTIANGAPVVVHDATTTRTMTGRTATVARMTMTDFVRRDVRTDGTPLSFTGFLNAHGGRSVIIPEVKVNDWRTTTTVVRRLADRRLQRSAIVQVGSLRYAYIPVRAGFQTLVLTNRATLLHPRDVRAKGVRWVGVSASTPHTYIRWYKAYGLRVLVYTVNDPATFRAKIAAGADGVFSDDPWLLDRAVAD